MFRHVLVPVDLSRRNAGALETAAELARRDGARVTLLHVIERIEHIAPRELRRFYADVQRTAERRLAPAARRVGRGGTPVRTVILVGSPARDVVRWADANDVDLIVMTSHRLDPRAEPRWGTTSYKVGLLCACPILLVK